MDKNTQQPQPEGPLNPGVAEQLEQIKKAVPGTSQRLFEFLVDNLKPIAVGCGALILAMGIYAGVNQWREGQVAKAADQLGVILIEKTEPKARVAALEAFLKDAPGSLRPSVLLELAASAMVDRQFDKAATAWIELEGSSSPDMKVVAGIGHARSLLLSDKAKDALALLTELKAKSPEAYATSITRQIAVAAEQAGETKVALDAYTDLAAKAEGSGKPFFEFKANQLKAKS
jgi:hypothetical protein